MGVLTNVLFVSAVLDTESTGDHVLELQVTLRDGHVVGCLQTPEQRNLFWLLVLCSGLEQMCHQGQWQQDVVVQETIVVST